MNQWRVDAQLLAEMESCWMERLALDPRPKLKLISMAAAAEATIATHGQVGDEVAWRIATSERTAATHAASLASQRVEADQFQHLLHRDASA